MSRLLVASRVICALLACLPPSLAPDRSPRTISLLQALQPALAASPRLQAREGRDIGIAGWLRLQAGALPDPEVSFELDNALGSGSTTASVRREPILASANDDAVRLGVFNSAFDQDTHNIIAAQETRAKTEAERAIDKLVLLNMAGVAYDALTGAFAEFKPLRLSVIPNACSSAETMHDSYSQGRFILRTVAGVATIEGLAGNPFTLTRESSR